MYKIEIWQRQSLVEVYEQDDIQNILAWFKWYWYGEYDCGGCTFVVYKNGIEMTFDELWELGFIK
jgi:hypothetical protein